MMITSIYLIPLMVSCAAEEIVRVDRISHKYGSLNGATRLTIYGQGFAKNQFNFGEDSAVGNEVNFVSDTQSFPCDIHKDGCTETQIMCYTRAMPHDNYFLRVAIDGVKVPVNKLCGSPTSGKCRFTPHPGHTPRISSVSPTSGPPGTLITMSGTFFTSKFGTHQDTSTNGRTNLIKRVYFGGHNCELLKPGTDEPYQIQLNNDGGSNSGTIKCLLKGTFVGNINGSIIVDGEFGRTMPDLSTKKVSGEEKIYMFQTYAEINSVSPTTGSTEGGTTLTISGVNFDETVAKAKVTVGGKKCEVISLTDNEIKCVTSSEAEARPVYPGNRGLLFEKWDDWEKYEGSFVQLQNYTNPNSSEIIDHASFLDIVTSDDYYVTRMRGFFVPPIDDDYTFMIRSDDFSELYLSTDDDPANKVKIAKCIRGSHRYDSDPGQTSPKKPLQKGKSYYIEVLHKEIAGNSNVHVAVLKPSTSIPGGLADNVWNEKQQIKTSSIVHTETQTIKRENWVTQTLVKEVQEVLIATTDPSNTKYRLGMHGGFTEPLKGTDSGSNIATALNLVPSIAPDTVSVTSQSVADGIQLTITFNSELGDFPDFEAKPAEGNMAMVTFRVTETTKGEPSMKYFALDFGGIPSGPIAKDASADDIKTVLGEMLSVRCPSSLTNPAGQGFFNEYETSVSFPESGTRTKEIEPFCGENSSKNPTFVFSSYNYNTVNLNFHSKFCFAYFGNLLDKLRVEYNYVENSENKHKAEYFTVPLPFVEGSWQYTCVDLAQLIMTARPSYRKLKLTKLYIYRNGTDVYVDSVFIGFKEPTTDFAGIAKNRRLLPTHARAQHLEVEDLGSDEFKISILPYDCMSNLPLLGALHAQPSGSEPAVNYSSSTWPSTTSWLTTRVMPASPLVAGTFSLTFNSHIITNLSAVISPGELKDRLETIPDMGALQVTRQGNCSGYTWEVEWLTSAGGHPLLELDGGHLTGTNVTIDIKRLQSGGILYNPIPGELLRTYEAVPQVEVTINNIPSKCNGTCGFEWQTSSTPTLTALSVDNGVDGDTLILTGTGFSLTLEDNLVLMGGVNCSVTAATATQLTCTVGEGPAGEHNVSVTVDQKGLAEHQGGTYSFTYNYEVTGISPSAGSLGGGTLLTVSGSGFGDGVTVTVDGNECKIKTVAYNDIICVTPLGTTDASVDVIVNEGSRTEASPQQFSYQNAWTPSVTSLSVTQAEVAGGTTLTIQGFGFGTEASAEAVTIGGKLAEIISYNDNQIEVVLPSLAPGSYSVNVGVDSKGLADLRSSSVPDIEYMLKVDNVYPQRGSLEGETKVTLTGEGFGTDSSLLDIRIGAYFCNVSSVSPTEITCITAPASKHHIIDNYGVHPNLGRGYAWRPNSLAVHIGDTVEWRWGLNDLIDDMVFRIEETDTPSEYHYNGKGFQSSPQSTSAGSYRYQFTTAGTYYYWSGFVDNNQMIYLRGTIMVQDRSSSAQDISVRLAGHEALYIPASGVSNPVESGCVKEYSVITGCADLQPSRSNPVMFDYAFWSCLTPTVSDISPNSGTTSDVITITGTGFSTTLCQNEVYIGDEVCEVSAATETSIRCSLTSGTTLTVGTYYPVKVVIGNRGKALMTIRKDQNRLFALLPSVTSVSPNSGSLNGGSLISISGDGFSETTAMVSISIGSLPCNIKYVNVSYIECETTNGYDHLANVTVTVNNGHPIVSVCEGSCEYQYSPAETPVISSVRPANVASTSSELTLSGTGFGYDSARVMVGDTECITSDVTDVRIVCDVTGAIVGAQTLSVVIPEKGLATFTPSTIMVDATLDAVNPTEGGTNGGTRITITGNGFKVDDTSVQIGSSDCPLDSVMPNQIVCTTPSHAETSEKVTVISNSVTYPQLDFTYTSVQTPTVSGISPSNGNPGDGVTISGTTFGTNPSDIQVLLGSTECTVVSTTDTSIACTVGVHAGGTFPVTVDVFSKGQATSTSEFTYYLTITSVSPTSGSMAGGQNVTISGTGFTADSTHVTVCGNPAVILEAQPSEMIIQTPFNDGFGTVQCDVIVEVDVYNETSSNAYTYETSMTPTISNVSPRRGGTGGGVRLTITGTGFGTTIEDVSVTIDGTSCIVDSTTGTEVQCVTEPHQPSIRTKIRLEISSNGIANQDNADFEYVDLWSSTYSWGGNPLPTKGEFVVIPKGMTMVLDVDTPVLKMLLIKGGELIFDETDVTLNAENILVTEGGLFQIGTETNPHSSKATVMLHGNLRSKELPIYGTKTLAIREGILDLHGLPAQPSWTRLGATANAGDTQITLEVPVNWNVGDSIAIASTGDQHSQSENEQHEITAISGDKRTLTLKEPLVYKHLGETLSLSSSSGFSFEARAEVGLLTRNVVVRGSNHIEWNDEIEACPEGFNTGEFATQTCFQGRFGEEIGSDGFGSQIMLHAPRANENLVTGRINNIEVTNCGQAFRLGRYAIHFHLNGNMNGSYVKNSAIHKSNNRAINVHGTHNVLLDGNTVYDIMGGAFFLEDGVETGNIIQNNLAIFVKQSTSLQNDDITPAAFWITNPDNIVRNNHAAGGTHFGFWYRMHTHPDGPSFDPNICPRNIPLNIFANNTVHSQGWFGLWIFQVYTPKVGGACSGTEDQAATFETLTTWNCEKGAESVTGGAIQFKGFKMINNEKAGLEYKLTSGPRFSSNGAGAINCDIAAKPTTDGILDESSTAIGIILPYSPGFQVLDTTFYNFDEAGKATFGVTQIDGKTDDLCGGFTHRVSGLVFDNSPNKAKFRWENEVVLHDVDGSLTGTVDGKAIPTSPILPPSRCTSNTALSIGQPGSVCDEITNFHRWSFNNPSPSSLLYKNVIFGNAYGNLTALFREKRVTHPDGWMVILPSGEEYRMTFEQAGHITNISYSGKFMNFGPSDYLIMRHDFYQKPDRVQIFGTFREPSPNPLTFANNVNGDYYFDDTTNKFTYLLSGKAMLKQATDPALIRDTLVSMKVYRCFYDDCITPVDSGKQFPTGDRPADAHYWSDKETWKTAQAGWGGNYGNGNFGPPKTPGVNVKIQKDDWVVLDVIPPDLGELHIHGVLEFEFTADMHLNLTCTHIFVAGGRLIVGTEKQPILGSAYIILRGDHHTPDMILPDGPNMGAKSIGVFGGFDAHGLKTTVSWTRLSRSALSGSPSIILEEPVDWSVGDEVVIAPSRFDAWETETRFITAISEDQMTLTLDSTLRFDHLVTTQALNSDASKTVTMAAEVGLLTRNVKIIGEEYPEQINQAFGARVIVGQFSQVGKLFTGFARLSNVEFKRSGQEGFIETYDPRYSLAWLNTGTVSDVKPSYVKSCAFNDGFAPAIGIFGANKIEVTDNVIYKTIWSSIILGGDNNRLRNNLVTMLMWSGAYNGRTESFNIKWQAGIKVIDATNPVLQNNVVAGSERAGFHINGVPCPGAANSAESWEGNTAHSTLVGVVLLKEDGLSGCTHVTGFTVYKNYDFGIYSQIESPFHVSNITSVDNNLGLFPMVIKPHAVTHEAADKYVKVYDSTFVGRSVAFDCTKDRFPNNFNFKASSRGRGYSTETGGIVGIGFATFSSSSNYAPSKPFINIKAYQAINGKMEISGVTFVNFGNKCGSKIDAAITTSQNNDDGIHPVYTSNIQFVNVPSTSKVFYHRPRLSKINPADCVDMDCDGLKKALLKDLDGSFFGGSGGAIIPESEWEWDGDPRRGLGDYRIPKAALTYPNGSRIPISEKGPKKGIIRDSSCVLKTEYNAWECHGLDYEMLVVESLDSDTETRRLSPIALFSDGYVDLINGPQDHGWCNGYTCQKRLSTFPLLVATGKEYELYYTGTSPQNSRLRLLNADSSQAIRIGIWFQRPNRLDVFKNKFYQVPENAGLDSQGRQTLKQPTTPGQYMPNVAVDQSGVNYFDRATNMLHIIVRGKEPIDIKQTPVVVVTFHLPAMTDEEFFGEQIVRNLALYLDIPPEKIRISKVVRANGRRKRAASMEVEIEIANQPATDLDSVPSDDLTADQLQEATSMIVTGTQTNILSAAVFNNTPILGMELIEPVPSPVSDAWNILVSSDETTASLAIQIPTAMILARDAIPVHEGAPFSIQPKIQMLDASGNLVKLLGSTQYPWEVTAVLTGGDPQATLEGNTTVKFIQGSATFTDLAVSHTGSDYVILFNITNPSTSAFSVRSSPLTIKDRGLAIRVAANQITQATVGRSFSLELEIIDEYTLEPLEDISWKGRTWLCRADLHMPELSSGQLSGRLTAAVNPATNRAVFSSFSLSAPDRYFIAFQCQSNPPFYTLKVISNYIDVTPVGYYPPEIETNKTVGLTFDADYDAVAKGMEAMFAAAVVNKIRPMVGNVSFTSLTATKGSIIVTFLIGGSNSDVNNATEQIWNVVENSLTLTFNGTTVEALKIMYVDGQEFNGNDSEPETAPPAALSLGIIIIAIAVACTVGLAAFILAVVIYKVKSRKKSFKNGRVSPGMSHKSVVVMNAEDQSYAQAADTSDSDITRKSVPPPDIGFKKNSWMKPSPREPKQEALNPNLLPRHLRPTQHPRLEKT